MTYTFKLARRLAVSRDYAMLAAVLLVAACAGESTAPETGPAIPKTASDLRVTPRRVTLEPQQKVQFKGLVHTATGDTLTTSVSWIASGGTIADDGSYTAGEPGTYRVVGRGRWWKRADTSVVVVVPTQPDLVSLSVTPDPVSLDAGASRTFAATGYLSDGTTAAVGVSWTATGGTIDAGGVYTAGKSGGAFRVVATHSAGTITDTASVSVAAAEPAPAPTLAKVILNPASPSLSTGATKQFTAFGRDTNGDSVAIAVTFNATGGTITSGGLYTAGSNGGTYRVIAASSGLADTSAVTITEPAPPPTGEVGLPFGPTQQLGRTGAVAAPFTLTLDGVGAGSIVGVIDAARKGQYRLAFNMTGGKHDNYMSTIDGVYQFDESKWRAQMNTFNTAAIKQAVADGVRDGVIVGNSVMDEPQVSGGPSGGGNTWGPKGTMTKARVDELCGYVKQIFPTMPVGVFSSHEVFDPTHGYHVCDFLIDQYDWRRGEIKAWRDAGLAMAERDGHAVLFSLNVLDGGVQDKDGTWDCTGAGQGGKGTYSPNCRMTATQVRDWGLLLGKAACGLLMWRYDATYMATADRLQAFKDVAAGMATAPAKACRRS